MRLSGRALINDEAVDIDPLLLWTFSLSSGHRVFQGKNKTTEWKSCRVSVGILKENHVWLSRAFGSRDWADPLLKKFTNGKKKRTRVQLTYIERFFFVETMTV